MGIHLSEIKNPATRLQIAQKLMRESKEVPPVEIVGKVKRRFSQRTKPKLNVLETQFRDFLIYLMGNREHHLYEQAITFELANGVKYRPDLALYAPTDSVPAPDCWTCYEVKGPWATQTGINKFKQAAHEYPMIRWIMVWKGKDNQWQTQEAIP